MAAKKTLSRHGKLADDRAQTSITMRKDLLEKCKREAVAQGRSLSNFLEQLVKTHLPQADEEKPVIGKPDSRSGLE